MTSSNDKRLRAASRRQVAIRLRRPAPWPFGVAIVLLCGCEWVAGLSDLSHQEALPFDAAAHTGSRDAETLGVVHDGRVAADTEAAAADRLEPASSLDVATDGEARDALEAHAFDENRGADADGFDGSIADAMHDGGAGASGVDANPDGAARLDGEAGAFPSDAGGRQCGAPMAPMPVAYWRLDERGCDTSVVEASGNIVTDAKRNGVDSGTGRIGLAAWFDGIDDRIELPLQAIHDFSTAMTVSAWVNPSRLDGIRGIVSKWLDKDSYALVVYNDEFRFSIAVPGGQWGTPYNVSAPATANTWTHVVGVFDGSRIMIYLDGELAAMTQVPSGSVLQHSARPIIIGNNHAGQNAYEGFIDEVRLYDVALAEADVASLAAPSTPAPVAYFRMEECSGTVSFDAFDDTKRARRQGGVATGAGNPGLASFFDGKSSQTEMADTAAFKTTAAVTVAAWVNPRTTDRDQYIVSRWYAPDSYLLNVDRGRYQFSIAAPSVTEQFGEHYAVSAPAVANQWTHVAGVFDGNQLLLYIDGCLRDAMTTPSAKVLQDSIRPLTIGGHPNGASFEGSIDEVRVYGIALSRSQIERLADPAYAW